VQGWKKHLELEDLLRLPPQLTCSTAYSSFIKGIERLQALHCSSAAGKDSIPGDHEWPADDDRIALLGDKGKKDLLQKSIGTYNVAAESQAGASVNAKGADGCNSKGTTVKSPSAAANGFQPSLESTISTSKTLVKLIWTLHKPQLLKALCLIYSYQLMIFWQPVLLKSLTEVSDPPCQRQGVQH
jgi:hypothetical protein